MGWRVSGLIHQALEREAVRQQAHQHQGALGSSLVITSCELSLDEESPMSPRRRGSRPDGDEGLNNHASSIPMLSTASIPPAAKCHSILSNGNVCRMNGITTQYAAVPAPTTVNNNSNLRSRSLANCCSMARGARTDADYIL